MSKFLISTLVVVGLTQTTAYAAEWSLTANANPSATYDDNVFLSQDEQSTMLYSITPTVVASRAVENSMVSVSAGYKFDRYSSVSNIDREDPFIRLDGSYNTERSSFGLNIGYQESSSRSTAEEDTGDFTTESTVRTRTIAPSFSHQLTEQDSVSINGSYSERDYSTSDFSDNDTVSITGGWNHVFTERLTGGLSATVSNYQADALTFSSDDDTYGLSATAEYALSELWQLNGQAGIRRLNSERKFTSGFKESDNSSGGTVDFSATRTGEIDTFTIGLSRGLIPSSTGDVNEQDRIHLAYSRNISDRLTAGLTASYQETTSALDSGSEKRENINVSPSLRWQLERNVGLNLAYVYREQQRDSAPTVDSNAVSLTLTYDWDGIRVSR